MFYAKNSRFYYQLPFILNYLVLTCSGFPSDFYHIHFLNTLIRGILYGSRYRTIRFLNQSEFQRKFLTTFSDSLFLVLPANGKIRSKRVSHLVLAILFFLLKANGEEKNEQGTQTTRSVVVFVGEDEKTITEISKVNTV